MSDIVERLQAANEWMRAPDWNDDLDLISWLHRRPAGGFQGAIDEITRLTSENEKLRAALASIDELFSEAAQDDCENGVRWLNERAASKYLAEYPHTSAAISLVHKTARAALSGDKHE